MAPLSPAALKARDYEPYREVIDTVLRHAGALRIDHAMSLYRLFWISQGFTAADGVYVRYPLAAMLKTLAEVSQARELIVIGEALGVVPKGFPEVLSATEIQAYVVYFFEKRGEDFVPIAEYPREALACITTHDLHTLAGWWSAHDLTTRRGFGYLKEEDVEQAMAERASERLHLLYTLADHELLPHDVWAVRDGHQPPPETIPELVAVALHRLVARSPSRLFVLAIEDLTGDPEQVNIPGTIDEHPNWRRRDRLRHRGSAGAPLLQGDHRGAARGAPALGARLFSLLNRHPGEGRGPDNTCRMTQDRSGLRPSPE